ncbi:arginine--tRNA ligase [bacterium BMS3Abin04]|nr:arginine--tRNA ligase [bacterium BMS3Abin04]
MRVLGESVKARYLELLGKKTGFSEEYYQGDYIKDIAKKLFREHGSSLENVDAEEIFKEEAEKEIFSDIQNTLNKLNIKFDEFFNEKTLYENGNIERVLKVFKEKNLSYEKDNAVWLKLSELGQEQDKVIVKSTGEPTYRLPDIAYHVTKFDRNYDLIVDIFGSDHNATFPDVLAGVEALGYDKEKVKVIIHQFVTIMQNGKVVKMSTRKANFITLEELIDEVGEDVVRYFFNMRNYSSHMNFDLGLAKKHSDENPVFYLQYAHARISSILRMTKEENLHSSLEYLELLEHPYEQSLLKYIARFPEEVYYAAINYEPHKIANYLEGLAAQFHKFYTECRIIGSEKNLAQARIALIIVVQIVLRNGLAILGVDAPNKM